MHEVGPATGEETGTRLCFPRLVGPIELYRPLLSYDELGGVLDRPSQLFDKLFSLLGLERIADGLKRLTKAHKELLAPEVVAKSLAAGIKPLLSASEDPRAAAAFTLLGKRPPDIAAVQALATGAESVTSGVLDAVRRLSRITVPDPEQVAAAAEELRAAVAALTGLAGSAVEISARHADLLREALNLHRDHGELVARFAVSANWMPDGPNAVGPPSTPNGPDSPNGGRPTQSWTGPEGRQWISSLRSGRWPPSTTGN